MHPGAGPGLTPRTLGEAGGEEAVTLTLNEMPSHTHRLVPAVTPTPAFAPGGNFMGTPPAAKIYGPPGNLLAMSPAAIRPVGGEPHDNRQPYLALNFIIALQGIFPARS
jgi:microcystin-dependent protein